MEFSSWMASSDENVAVGKVVWTPVIFSFVFSLKLIEKPHFERCLDAHV
jgi:hypothetical protein